MNEPDLRCYYHPEREATSQCDRCGDYLCSDCVNDHDELHVCARCFEDVTPREEIGRSAKIACVLHTLACPFLLVTMGPLLESASRTFTLISMTMSVAAFLLALSDMRGRASGELFFRWSLITSAGASALCLTLALLAPEVFDGTGGMFIVSVCLVPFVISVVLMRASEVKKVRPTWALKVALFAPLSVGSLLLVGLAAMILKR